MKDEIKSLIRKYASRGILVDTNILLMYFVGTLSKERIARFKRTDHFDSTDYDRLVTLLANFRTILTTPNILTEVNSLMNQLGEPARSACYSIFARKVCSLEEVYLTDDLKMASYLYGCGIDTINFNNLRAWL